MKKGRLEWRLLYGASRLIILFLLPVYISDVELYGDFAFRLIKDGLLPYRDFPYEYPPLAYTLILIPAWIHHQLGLDSVRGLRILLGLVILPFDLLLFRRLEKHPLRNAAFYYVFLTSLLPYLLFDRLDLMVGFAIAWPYLREKTRDSTFSLSWGLGGGLKLIPFLLFPMRLLDKPGFSGKRLAALGIFPALLLLLSLGLAGALGHGQISFLNFHTHRGVQLESLAASVVMTGNLLGYAPAVDVQSNFGAQHLEYPWLIALAKGLFWGGMGISLLLIVFLRRRLDSLSASWLLLLSFLVFGYVLSPQYLFWLIPLSFPLAWSLEPRIRRRFLLLFGIVVAGTGLHFHFYWDYAEGRPASLLLLLARNLLLLALLACSWRWLLMRRPSGSASQS